MNKSERKTLANIVCGMMYSFHSTPEVVGAGEEILREFPSIGEELASLRVAQAEVNVCNVIVCEILKLWDPDLFNKEIRSLRDSTVDTVDEIFNTYLYSMEHGSWDENILALENRVGSADDFRARQMVKEIVESESWAECVSEIYGIGTREYNYLTYKH
ncbi:TPA: hypothetical protein ACSCYS_004220 [Aeromonas veronii]